MAEHECGFLIYCFCGFFFSSLRLKQKSHDNEQMSVWWMIDD